MSSTQGASICPRCGLLGSYIYYSGSGDYWFQCFFCGFNKEIIYFPEKDPDEVPFWLEESKNSYNYSVHISEINPVGAICIVTKTGHAQFGYRPPRPDKVEIRRFKRIMKKPDVDSAKSYLTRWNPEKGKVIYLIGNPSKFWKEEIDFYESDQTQEY